MEDPARGAPFTLGRGIGRGLPRTIAGLLVPEHRLLAPGRGWDEASTALDDRGGAAGGRPAPHQCECPAHKKKSLFAFNPVRVHGSTTLWASFTQHKAQLQRSRRRGIGFEMCSLADLNLCSKKIAKKRTRHFEG